MLMRACTRGDVQAKKQRVSGVVPVFQPVGRPELRTLFGVSGRVIRMIHYTV